jgi:Na+/melibiose symporter-like transporter
MAEAVYILCALTSLLCAVLLFARYRKTRVGLLFWSAVAFVFFTATNIALYADLVLTPREVDLSVWRSGLALAGVVVLLFGLIRKK